MDDHLLGRFCGSRKPLTLVSSYNLLYLVFRSDATNERRGFNATHTTSKWTQSKSLGCLKLMRLKLILSGLLVNISFGANFATLSVCGGRLQASLNQNGLIYSHPSFDGATHYNRNEDCDWIIEANENQRVRVEFTYFSLEADSGCNYDNTIIYDGPDDSATQLARLCGSEVSFNGSSSLLGAQFCQNFPARLIVNFQNFLHTNKRFQRNRHA